MNTLVKSAPRYENIIQLTDSPFGKLSTILQDRTFMVITILVLSVFVSALGVVYNQEENRLLFNQLSSMQKNRDALYVEWGQLLLEESTWATQSRVQKIAAEKLNMVVPNQQNIVIVRQ